jgi:outer membrane protein TolC
MNRCCTIACLLAAACGAVRPIHLDPPKAPPSFLASELAATPGNTAEALKNKPPPNKRATRNDAWWNAFADPALDAALDEAMHNNYFIKDVRTLIVEDTLDATIPQGWWWPLQVGIPAVTPAGIQRVEVGSAPVPASKDSPAIAASQLKYQSTNVGVTASYQLDLWGNLAARRAAGINFSEQQRQSAELAAQNLAEQFTQLWFDVLVERALKELTLGEVKYNQELYNIIKARFDQHLTSRLTVLQQEQQLVNIQAQVPLITARIAVLNSQLTGLLGRLPRPVDDLIPQDRRLPDLPPPPDLGTPDDLNATTPEMRFARLRVTEIEHRVNQNLSSWLPVIELVGSAGIVSYDFDSVIRESFAGVRLSWPVFDGGRRITESKQLDLTLKRRKWQYDLAIKTQVGRVQDALLQEKNQAESLASLRAQIELGGRLLEEARRIFEQGQSDYLPVLTALSNLAVLQREGLRAQRLLLSYRVQLYRALGGNWSYDVTNLPD